MSWLSSIGIDLCRPSSSGGGTPTPTPAPSFSVQPSITGTPQVGVSFVGTPGTASNTTGHTYRWLLATTSGGTYTAISGATSASYTPVSGDETKYLKFEDTATGSGGSTVATTAFAGPVAAAAAATAPVLTKTSASGVNPMAWSGYYADMAPDSDYITMRWRVNSGSWNNDTNHLFTTGDFLDSEDGAASFVWPLFQAASPFAAGALVEVQEGVLRGAGPTVWSSIISDTMATVPWVYNAAPAVFTVGFSTADPVTFAAETFAAGTGIVCLAASNNPPASVTIAGAAMTLVSSKTNGNDGLYIYAKSGITAGSKDIVVTPSTMNLRVYGIATGTLASSINATPTATASQNYGFNGDPQTSGTFTLPANGVAIALVGPVGTAVVTTWDSGFGTANTERHGSSSGDFQFATASMVGGASSAAGQSFKANGYNFSGSMMTVAVFGP